MDGGTPARKRFLVLGTGPGHLPTARKRAALPLVFSFSENYAVGEEVPAFVHNDHSLGYARFDYPLPTDYDRVVKHLRDAR